MPTPCGSPTVAEFNETISGLYRQILTLTIALVENGLVSTEQLKRCDLQSTHIMDQMEAGMRDEFFRRQREAIEAFLTGRAPSEDQERDSDSDECSR
jgi:hypothetical protein